jgi:hypothetical protein
LLFTREIEAKPAVADRSGKGHEKRSQGFESAISPRKAYEKINMPKVRLDKYAN